jgi:hypothetical protein
MRSSVAGGTQGAPPLCPICRMMKEKQIHALGHSIGAIARSLYPGLAKNLLFACCLDMQYKDKLQMDEEIWSTKALTKIVWRFIDLPLRPIGRRNPSFAGRG